MAQPTQSDVHVNALMTDLSLLYTQEEGAYVAHKVFPIIPVNKQSDRYTIFSRADMNRNTMRLRAPGTESAGGGWNVDTTPTYFAPVYAIHKDIDDQTLSNADSVFDLHAESTRWCTAQGLTNKETNWGTAFFGTGIWTTSWTTAATTSYAAGTAGTVIKWSDPASTPITDVRFLKQYIQLAGIYRPNKGVMNRVVFDTLCDHPDFIDRVKYGQTASPNLNPAIVNMRTMAEIFELDEVLVMDSIINSGGEQATLDSGGTSGINAGESNAFIGGNNMLLVYTPARPGRDTPGCGYTFAWTGYLGANAVGGRMKNFRIEQIESERVEYELSYQFKQVSADLGGFLSGLV